MATTETPTLDELSAEYRRLKAERARIVTAPKQHSGDGRWPPDVLKAAKQAELPPADYVAQNLDPDDAARLAEIDGEMQRLSDQRRRLRKAWRQRAAQERAAGIAQEVEQMTDAEREEYRRQLGQE